MWGVFWLLNPWIVQLTVTRWLLITHSNWKETLNRHSYCLWCLGTGLFNPAQNGCRWFYFMSYCKTHCVYCVRACAYVLLRMKSALCPFCLKLMQTTIMEWKNIKKKKSKWKDFQIICDVIIKQLLCVCVCPCCAVFKFASYHKLSNFHDVSSFLLTPSNLEIFLISGYWKGICFTVVS